MKGFFQKISDACRNQKKENDSDNEEQTKGNNTQNYNEENYIQLENNQVNSNINEVNHEKNINGEIQQNEDMKYSQLSSSKYKKEQIQICNQNESENNDLNKEFQIKQIQTQKTSQLFQSQSPIIDLKSKIGFNLINQNIDQSRNQIYNQQSEINNTKSSYSKIQFIDQNQRPYNQNDQEQQIYQYQPYNQQSQIKKEQFQTFNNSEFINQQNYNMQMYNSTQNYIDNQRNNQIYNQQHQQLYNNQQHQQLYNNQQNQQNQKQMSNIKQDSQLKINNSRFNSFTSSQCLTNYQSCNDDLQSKILTQQIRCQYCQKEVHSQYFQLKCQHFYCSDCLKEFLKTQSKQNNCYIYKCFCSREIKLQLFFHQKDRAVDILKEKMILNQINALKQNIQEKYKLKNCRNKYCQFFVILQENLDSKYFYCPSCLEKQSYDQLNK